MRKWLATAVVVLAVAVLVQGLLYAPPGRGGRGRGMGPGRMPGDDGGGEKMASAAGIIREVKWDDEKKTGSIVLGSGRKNKKGHEAKATLFVNFNTQVFIGDEEKSMNDLAEGDKVKVGYPKPKKGVTPVAVMIFVDKKEDKDKDAGDKAGDATDADAGDATAEE